MAIICCQPMTGQYVQRKSQRITIQQSKFQTQRSVSGIREPVGHMIRPIQLNASISANDPVSFNDGNVKIEGDKALFKARDGKEVEILAQDYGFRSDTMRMYSKSYGSAPVGLWKLAKQNFDKELMALRQYIRFEEYKKVLDQENQSLIQKALTVFTKAIVSPLAFIDKTLQERGVTEEVKEREDDLSSTSAQEIKKKLSSLVLDNKAVDEREAKLKEQGLFPQANPVVNFVYRALCVVLDILYDNRPIQRFWVLETVARMPYFSYISLLHLYESLGWYRAGAALRLVHFAEEWNELHHLQTMEALGGDELWFDRFLGYHAAIVYYWAVILIYVISPEQSYKFSELVETHATETYREFAEANEELLKTLPPPLAAVSYYLNEDVYMFDTFMTDPREEPRRPPCNNLYDTFINIRDDEIEHRKTMKACQDENIQKQLSVKNSQSTFR